MGEGGERLHESDVVLAGVFEARDVKEIAFAESESLRPGGCWGRGVRRGEGESVGCEAEFVWRDVPEALEVVGGRLADGGDDGGASDERGEDMADVGHAECVVLGGDVVLGEVVDDGDGGAGAPGEGAAVGGGDDAAVRVEASQAEGQHEQVVEHRQDGAFRPGRQDEMGEAGEGVLGAGLDDEGDVVSGVGEGVCLGAHADGDAGLAAIEGHAGEDELHGWRSWA